MTRRPYSLSRAVRHLYDQEYDIREALKRFYKGNTFSLRGVGEAQAADRALMTSNGFVEKVDTFHVGWETLDLGRRSSACLIEQRRAQFFALGPIFAELQPLAADLWHLTFANPKDQRPTGELRLFKLKGYKSKIRRVLKQLQARYPSLVALAIVEISAAPSSDGGVIFKPHVHVLAHGVPVDELRAAFRQLLTPKPIGHPIRIDPVGSIPDLGRVLSYMFKFAPKIRSKIIGRNGSKEPGKPNFMQGPVLAEWLAWFAEHRVADLLINIGLRPGLMREMRQRDVSELIPRLLKESRRMPPRSRRRGVLTDDR